MIYANIYYFKKINGIGGTEQFLYEIAKKYKDYDITIVYDEIDEFQYERLSKLVRCVQHHNGQKIKCNKAFFNFNIDAIDDIEANQYYFVAHACYEDFGYKPPIKNEKLTDYIGVSDYASSRMMSYAKKIGKDVKAVTCYNPLTLEPKEKVVHLVSACRLGDSVKGGDRTLKLIKALDKYCEKTGRHYIWTIFTDACLQKIESKNVCIMKPRVDVRPYIQDADYVLQLSNDMETYCYTINEALGYGVPVVTTPLTVLKELPVTENEMIKLEYDCSNVDEVARLIFEKEVKPFKYIPPEDDWINIFDNAKSTYEEEKRMKYKVEATELFEKSKKWDGQRSTPENKIYPKKGDQWIVDYDRKETLLKLGYITVVEEIKEELSKPVMETKEVKSVKKTRKNTNKKT